MTIFFRLLLKWLRNGFPLALHPWTDEREIEIIEDRETLKNYAKHWNIFPLWCIEYHFVCVWKFFFLAKKAFKFIFSCIKSFPNYLTFVNLFFFYEHETAVAPRTLLIIIVQITFSLTSDHLPIDAKIRFLTKAQLTLSSPSDASTRTTHNTSSVTAS